VTLTRYLRLRRLRHAYPATELCPVDLARAADWTLGQELTLTAWCRAVTPLTDVEHSQMPAGRAAAHALQDGGGKTVAQQIADAIAHFRDTWNVTVSQIEELRVLSGELARGERRVEDEFPTQRVTVADITGKPTQAPAQSDDPEQDAIDRAMAAEQAAREAQA
jgi:hypothetical protein